MYIIGCKDKENNEDFDIVVDNIREIVMDSILKFIFTIDFLTWLICFVCCVLVFAAMYDHCVYKKPFWPSLKTKLLNLILSQALTYVIVIILVISIVYIIHSIVF